MWLDFEADEKFGKTFNELSKDEVLAIVDEVAWPDKAKPEYLGGVRWFNMLRNLTCSAISLLKRVGNTWVMSEIRQMYGMAFHRMSWTNTDSQIRSNTKASTSNLKTEELSQFGTMKAT